MNTPTLAVTGYGGIRNKVDPQMLGLTGFTACDNLHVDSSGVLWARPGQTEIVSTAYRGAFSTVDAKRTYAVTTAGALENWAATPYTIASGFLGYPYWTQVADVVFVGNENQVWRIGPDHVVEVNALTQPVSPQLVAVTGSLPAGQYRFVVVSVANGRESAPSSEAIIEVDGSQDIQVNGIAGQRLYVCPADSKAFGWWRDTTATSLVYAATPEQLGEELATLNTKPMRSGRCLAMYQGRLHCIVYDSLTHTSRLYRSVPQWWDLWEGGYKLIPGEVRGMMGHPQGLVIGTDRQLFSLIDDQLVKLADYGVPPGQSMCLDQAGQVLIWTQRGACSALPFAELTPHHAPPVADWVGTCVVREGGDQRLVATLSPFADPDNEV